MDNGPDQPGLGYSRSGKINQKGTRMANDFATRGRTGPDKAVNFATYIKTFGWSGNWSYDENTGFTHLSARRGENETIDIWWPPSGSLLADKLPVYKLAGESIRCRNVSAAAQIACEPPDESRLVKAVRRQKRTFDTNENGQVTQETIAALAGTLPFDAESTDEELKDALIGRNVTWVNRHSGETDSAMVSTDPKHFKVTRNGHDYLTFVYPIPQRVLANFGKVQDAETYGFRSVYLDSIVSVD